MKKFTFVLSLLVAFAAVAMAQDVVTTINTEKLYTLECRSGAAHSTTRFIGVNAEGKIDGHSSTPADVAFESGDDDGSYYIKVGDKYINCDGDKLSASETKSTAWVLGTVGNTVTFKYPGNTKYLNNNGTTCADGTIVNLQANNHPSGPNAGNACSTWQMCEYAKSEPEPTETYYRIKDAGTGLYMNAGNYLAHPTGPIGGVNFVEEAESDDQIFVMEVEGSDVKLQTKSGKYIYCQNWNVDALDEASVLTFEENGDGTFKIKCANGYFKVENVVNAVPVATIDGVEVNQPAETGTYPFCDAASGDAANFQLVEVVVVEDAELLEARAAFAEVYAAAVEVLNEAYSNEYPLQVTKDNEPYYIWTNQPEATEGPISQLVDGIIGNTSNDNFFHTNWHGDSEPIHYIEIDLGEGNGVKDFSFSYTTRAAVQNDYPDAIQVVGSNVKNGEYTQIANITSGLPQTGRTAYKSQEFHSAEAYRYIRFNVSAERKYWHMTEFDLLCCAGEYKFIKEAYQSKQAEYEALLSLYNQHANTANYTAEQYNAATEAINNAIIAATKLSEAQKAEAAAFFDVYAGKVGYPVQSVIDTYKASIAEAESESEIEAAKQVVYASTDVNLPVAGKAYTLTVVAKNGNKYYLNYTGSNIAIVARAENAELPLTALYGCEAYDGGVALKTVDGNYLVFCSKNATFGSITDGNTQGFQSELNAMAKLTFAKIANGGSVSANNNEQLFGLLSWNSLRGHKDSGEELTGYMVIKTSDATYDGAGAPFFNDNFSSAILLEEYSNQPTVGGFYNIRSANTYRNYVNTTALIYTNANNAVKWANGHGAANSNAVWTIEKDGNNYYAKNLHTGMYLNGLSMSETPATVAPSLLGDDQYIIIANGNMLHAQSSGNGIAGYDCRWDSQVNKSNASAWYIDEVESFGYTLAVSAAEWSTLILGYNAVIPENVTCYAVSSINGDWATLSEVEGVLPANTAVFVNAAQGEYTFTYTANTAEATSMLAGTLYNKNVTPATGATVYVLSKVGDVVGLYPAKVEDGTVYNNANKAYLEIASASKAIQFNFEGTTGVEDVQGADVETVIYDLTGRRVQQMNAAGIYIVNGKKVLVK